MMRCFRCGNLVPEWLWIGDDHPALHVEVPTTSTVVAVDEPAKVIDGKIFTMRWCKSITTSTNILDLSISMPIEEAVGITIGAASMCWEHVEDAGVFDSSRASQITNELVEYIKSKGPIY